MCTLSVINCTLSVGCFHTWCKILVLCVPELDALLVLYYSVLEDLKADISNIYSQRVDPDDTNRNHQVNTEMSTLLIVFQFRNNEVLYEFHKQKCYMSFISRQAFHFTRSTIYAFTINCFLSVLSNVVAYQRMFVEVVCTWSCPR